MTAWLVIADKDDPHRRLVLSAKANLSRMATGLAFGVESKTVGSIDEIAFVIWSEEPVTMTADEALAAEAASVDRDSPRNVSEDWLRELLSEGPVSASEVQAEAKKAGLSMRTVRRAQADLGIRPRKSSFGGPWEWTLPNREQTEGGDEDAQDGQC